jgi:hypothetical protein
LRRAISHSCGDTISEVELASASRGRGASGGCVCGALSLELIAMPRRPRRRNPRPLLYDTGLERRRTACATKERYASEAEARSIALMNAPPRRRASTTPYHCDVCGGWHLTSL